MNNQADTPEAVAALKRIADLSPATQEVSLAHEMAAIAADALSRLTAGAGAGEANEHENEFALMLWKWFEDRGHDLDRDNGHDAEDFRVMLEDHEAELLASPAPQAPAVDRVEDVAAYNVRFDAADEAGQDVFNNGFWHGWMWARYPDWTDDEDAAREEFNRETEGVALGEAWEAHRKEFFKRLPLAALTSTPEAE